MVSENKEYNKALKELIKMGKKNGSLTEKQVVEKTITLELTDEELKNIDVMDDMAILSELVSNKKTE